MLRVTALARLFRARWNPGPWLPLPAPGMDFTSPTRALLSPARRPRTCTQSPLLARLRSTPFA